MKVNQLNYLKICKYFSIQISKITLRYEIKSLIILATNIEAFFIHISN